MELDAFVRALNKEDFHIDELGCVVIDDPELLAMINGAGDGMPSEDIFGNIFCHNAHCR